MDFIIFLKSLKKFNPDIGNLKKLPLNITLLYCYCIKLKFGDDLI